MYKLVTKENGLLYSFAASGLSRVEYTPLVETFPPQWIKRGLFVFAEYFYVMMFMNSIVYNSRMELWKCNVVNPRSPGECYSISELSLGKIVHSGTTFALGTQEVSSLTLIERIPIFPNEPIV